MTGPAPEPSHDERPADTVRGPWQGQPNVAGPASTNEALAVLKLTWEQYSAWRVTKCPPPEYRGAIWFDELDQAIHEMIGEIGELAGALMTNGPFLFVADPESTKLRKHIQDEVGDVVFTTSWVFDLIDPSFLATRGRIVEGFLPSDAREALRKTHTETAGLGLTPGLLNHFHKAPDEVQAVTQFWVGQLESTLLGLFINAAPISNRFKKLRWQRMASKGNPFYEQASQLFNVVVGLDAVCELTGVSLIRAVHGNMIKLDQRFPDGWKPGGGKR